MQQGEERSRQRRPGSLFAPYAAATLLSAPLLPRYGRAPTKKKGDGGIFRFKRTIPPFLFLRHRRHSDPRATAMRPRQRQIPPADRPLPARNNHQARGGGRGYPNPQPKNEPEPVSRQGDAVRFGSQSSTLLPSGSRIQAKRPFASSSVCFRIATSFERSRASIASMSSTA